MAKKQLFLGLVLAGVVSGFAFAQDAETHKHQAGDMLVGIDAGLGVTTNIGDFFKNTNIPKGNYAFVFEAGVHYDYYLSSLLSATTGLLYRNDIYFITDKDQNAGFNEVAKMPFCFTVPIEFHVNIPDLEWLYAGVGVNLNLAFATPAGQGTYKGRSADDWRGDRFFVGLPIDLGFDFIRAGHGGPRIFFRITPEFHSNGTVLPLGVLCQFWNWRKSKS